MFQQSASSSWVFWGTGPLICVESLSHLLERNLDAEVATGNHDAVRHFEDFVEVLNACRRCTEVHRGKRLVRVSLRRISS